MNKERVRIICEVENVVYEVVEGCTTVNVYLKDCYENGEYATIDMFMTNEPITNGCQLRDKVIEHIAIDKINDEFREYIQLRCPYDVCENLEDIISSLETSVGNRECEIMAFANMNDIVFDEEENTIEVVGQNGSFVISTNDDVVKSGRIIIG